MKDQLAPHVDELKRALDEKDVETLEKDLYTLIVDFRVPVEEAKRTLLRKYGGEHRACKLKAVHAGDRSVDVTVRVLDVTKRSIKSGGKERTVFSGTLADETRTLPFTAWQDFDLVPGQAICIRGAYVRSWRGQPELNLGDNASVEPSDDNGLPMVDEVPLTYVNKLRSLRNGDRGVCVEVVVLSAEERNIETRDGPRRIISGVIADATAKLPFTLWEMDQGLATGDIVCIDNAYVRSWRGVPTVNIGQYSSITPIEAEISFSGEPNRIAMGELVERDGAFDVAIEGNILSVRPGSGLIARCPQCGRVVQKNTCRAHGQVNGELDMRIKAILDDGTGSLTLVLNRDLTEYVTGFTLDEAKEIAQDSMTTDVIEERLRRWLTGRPLVARGNMSSGEYGVMMVAEEVRWPDDDTVERAREFLGCRS